QRGNRLLYDEFRQHYVQMGQKSFDHTKKFWFNKLRKQYALLEEEETTAKDQAVSAEILETMSPDSAGIVAASGKPAGFKPRFKSGATKAVEPEKSPDAESKPVEPEVPSSKPAGFKPRFKAGATKAAAPETSADSEFIQIGRAARTRKPAGFKPRYTAGATKTEAPEAAADHE